MKKCTRKEQYRGFTLMEVVVSVTIFASVVTLMLTLFNQTLRIYRRTEAIRQATQSVRATVEFIVKEVRNGQIDYSVQDGQVLLSSVSPCPEPIVANEDIYTTGDQTKVGVKNVDGQRECIYWVHDDGLSSTDPNNNNIFIQVEGLTGASQLNPPKVKFTKVKFVVRPSHDPFATPLPGIMPSVTIAVVAVTTLPTGEVFEIPYQTTVSTYQYDIPF